MQVVIDIPETYYEYCKAQEDAAEIQLAIKNGTPLPKGSERLINADELARRIAGHSDYHGDNILSAIYCMAEGKHSDEPIKPLKKFEENMIYEPYKAEMEGEE